MKTFITACLAVMTMGFAHADDTEIFRSEYDNGSARPKVLIIFDTSGSMDTNVNTPKPPYDPATIYPTVSGINSGRLYWATGSSGNPPSANTSQWFNAEKNRCASSYTPLGNQGFYTDRLARWATSSSSSWNTLSSNSSNRDPLHVDCRADVSSSNNGNGTGTGTPGDGYPRSSNPRPYGSSRQTNVANDWSTYRVYSANYMNWYHSTTLVATSRSRIDIAQDVITDIIEANPGIDFGLSVFNDNSSGTSTNNGGRIARRIIENMSATERSGLVTIVNGLRADSYTPLCETTYEAYRYLTGMSPLWGNSTNPSSPVRDAAAQSGGNYVSPMADCQYTYVILMTDGEPTYDTSANSAIESLTGKTCSSWRDGFGGNTKNCLPEIAEYMFNNDLDNDPDNGIQKAVTYTIGFATNQTLLQTAATKGGGLYFTANDADELTAAFQGAITGILSTNTTFTSPAVAVNNYSRTESRNEVFFAMFKPSEGTNWPGNIKKLKAEVNASTGILQLLDANNVNAIDPSTSLIKDTATTYWGTSVDGPEVDQGGVGQKLVDLANLDTRKIKTNTGNAGALQDFNSTNVNRTAFGMATDADLFNLFNVADQAELNDLLAWARGWTNNTKSAKREWIMGDILHSRPVILDYGARTSSYTVQNPDLRVAVGTNAGFLHFFNDADGSESWAFFPKELASILEERRANVTGAANIYGVDAPIVVYRHDANNNGKILPTDTVTNVSGAVIDRDKMLIFFGLRRGGSALYALDVTNPDSPSFLWKVDADTSGFAELGQSWSTPVITKIPGYASPVLVFGGGYDTDYDSKTTTTSSVSGTQGRGIFIIDAQTGAMVWSTTSTADSSTNKYAPFAHSFVAPVSVLDANGDGITDIIYAPDVGGNIWRIDLASTTRPTTAATQANWFVNKVAALAGTTHASDRRFFNTIDVVRTKDSAGNSHTVLALGSGDRTNPNATDNTDRFFVVHDKQLQPFNNTNPTTAECDPSTGTRKDDVRCTWPLDDTDLYNATSNLIQVGTIAEKSAAVSQLNASKGWFINLGATGEKSLSRAITLAGTVYFTTFSPDPSASSASVCVPSPGTARLYAVKLSNAAAAFDLNSDTLLTTADRSMIVGNTIEDTPTPFYRPDGTIDLITQDGQVIQTQSNLRRRTRTYWYQQ